MARRAVACPLRPAKIIVGDLYSNYTHLHKQPPKSGYGFLQAVIAGVVSRAGALIELLEAPHQHGGNPSHPASAMLAAIVMRYALNERYANGFLNRLGSDQRLLEICGLAWAPSERAYSQFQKKLAAHHNLLRYIIADIFLECGVEIERLRAMGLVPADKPPLGHSLVIDSTDIEAWARPGRKSRKTGEEIRSKDPDAEWGHRTAKNVRSSKPRSGKRSRSKTAKTKGTGNGAESGQKENKDESYFGYKVDFITDANYGLPMFAETRPANASDVVVMIQDLDDCLAFVPDAEPAVLPGRQGLRQPEKHHAHHQPWHDSGGSPFGVPRRTSKPGSGCGTGSSTRTGGRLASAARPWSTLKPTLRKATCSDVPPRAVPSRKPSSSRGTATTSTTRSLKDGCSG